MIAKIILFIFLYLVCGVIVLEIVMFHDRHVKWIDEWLLDSSYDEQVLVVVGMPFYLFKIILWGFQSLIILLIKLIRTAYTAAIYTIIACFRSNHDRQE